MLAREEFLLEKEEEYRKKFFRRTGVVSGKSRINPVNKVRHFDPVYCARNANFLSKTIWYKVLAGTYEVSPAKYFEIKKENGGVRPIMAFSIPDAALANIAMRRARFRNIKNISAYSFAYHPNKNLFDAVLEIRRFDYVEKLFAVQIDFEKFFDSIPTNYIISQINDENQITLTEHERFIFKKFLNHRYAKPNDYAHSKFKVRHRGVPQGSSVSLVLANLANNRLDRSLEVLPGRFARFADDVVALCESYESALRIEKRFFVHCKNSGLKVNKEKSPGISIISSYDQEVRTDSDFVFLGYKFTEGGLMVPDKSIRKIKSRISRLIHIYLIMYLKFGYSRNRSSSKSPVYDWDLLGLIYEIRRSVYGGLSESIIISSLINKKRLPSMRGMMGFFCLIDVADQFRELDGWMLSAVRRAMKVRNDVLGNKFGESCPTPKNADLAKGTWLEMGAWTGNQKPDARMPSFVRGWRAARKYYFTYGLENVQPPMYGKYMDFSELFRTYT